MNPADSTYAVPHTMEPDLARLHSYWDDLIRAESTMPFSDDVDITKIPELGGSIILLTAFENPQRFRIETAGDRLSQRYGAPLNGEFSDELQPRPPVEQLTEQCAATIMGRRPTYYRSEAAAGYSRLLLPTWGDGHIMLLLGAVAEAQNPVL